MTLIGLHHAAVHVSSLERSIAFYQDVFGLQLAERFTLGAEKLAFFEVGSSRLELIEDGMGQRATGVVDHFAVEVDDLGGWLSRLRDHGVRLLDEAPVEVRALGARILFCLGPDEERIELFERT
jgi:lactoylglutathione lyase